ncbi:hypothetical protein ON010_g4554 [Phytophthora cinnamomi]|nr:hypothetical protein ON010_g4554 [Phytophthora cinnamomi]
MQPPNGREVAPRRREAQLPRTHVHELAGHVVVQPVHDGHVPTIVDCIVEQVALELVVRQVAVLPDPLQRVQSVEHDGAPNDLGELESSVASVLRLLGDLVQQRQQQERQIIAVVAASALWSPQSPLHQPGVHAL